MVILAIIGLLVIIVIIFTGGGIFGWLLKGIGSVFELLLDGWGSCLRIIVWIFIKGRFCVIISEGIFVSPSLHSTAELFPNNGNDRTGTAGR